MTTIDRPTAAAPEFASLPALHAAHGALLRRHREAGLTAELLQEIETFVRRGQATGAVLDADADRAAAQTLLDYWDTTLDRAGREIDDPILAEFDDARSPELDDSLCPYVGLDAFREVNHDKFFRRQGLLNELIGRLRSQRLLVVLGRRHGGRHGLTGERRERGIPFRDRSACTEPILTRHLIKDSGATDGRPSPLSHRCHRG